MLPAETQRIIDKHGIKYVLAQFVDIHGAAKTKSVPICGLVLVDDALGFCWQHCSSLLAKGKTFWMGLDRLFIPKKKVIFPIGMQSPCQIREWNVETP